jgi:hypothetical protein
MEAEVDNDVGENASDSDCPKSSAATSPSYQFPLFSISIDNVNQHARKAKDSLEDKKKGSGGSNNNNKKLSSFGGGNSR